LPPRKGYYEDLVDDDDDGDGDGDGDDDDDDVDVSPFGSSLESSKEPSAMIMATFSMRTVFDLETTMEDYRFSRCPSQFSR
jgi:hypothetical protein